MRCSGASLTIEAPNASATIKPASAGKMSQGTPAWVAKNSRSQLSAIIHPFLVGAKIGHRGFYFDNDDFTVAAKRDQVGAPARRQRQFTDDAIAERMKITRGASRDCERRFRLPPVHQRRV